MLLAVALLSAVPAQAPDSPRVHGWAEFGYSYASSAAGPLAVEPLLNRFGREFLVNQLAVVVERPAAPVGFYAQVFAGADAATLAGPGDIQTGDPRFGAVVRQVYASWVTDVGVELRAGRMGSLMGFESYQAPRRPFYSLSYQWNFAEDGADTGLWATWHVNPRLDLTYGVTLGSNTFFTLAGDAPCHLMQVALRPTAATTWTATLVIGDEAVGKTRPANPGSLATVAELRLRQAWTDRLTHHVQLNVGCDQDVPGVGVGAWYGALTAVVAQLSDDLQGAVRLEWFDDAGGTRTGVATHYAAVTAAATWSPWPRVAIRPEVRGDFAGVPAFGPQAGPPVSARQWTAGVECVLRF